MILNYRFAGSYYNRAMQNLADFPMLGLLGFFVTFILAMQYVKYYEQDENARFCKDLLESIPYMVGFSVVSRALELDLLFYNFELLHEFKFYGFVYLLAYFLDHIFDDWNSDYIINKATSILKF